MKCPHCSSQDIEFHDSSGDAVCAACGTVLEENSIVSSLEFFESGDRTNVVGQFVGATSSKVSLFILKLVFSGFTRPIPLRPGEFPVMGSYVSRVISL